MSIDIDELWTTAAVRFQLDLPPGGQPRRRGVAECMCMRGGPRAAVGLSCITADSASEWRATPLA
jgi:hypothetical protein